MSLWMVRAGSRGEYEAHFVYDSRIYLTWEELPDDLSGLPDRQSVRQLLERVYPPHGTSWIPNHTGEIATFLFRMEPGDHVLVPRQGAGLTAVGRITGHYTYDGSAPASYRHARSLTWLSLEVPRAHLDEDIQRSLRTQLTICRVGRDDAEARLLELLKRLP